MKPTSLPNRHRWLLWVAALAASCGCSEETRASDTHREAGGDSGGSTPGGTASGGVTPSSLTSSGVTPAGATSGESTTTDVTPPGGTSAGTSTGGATVTGLAAGVVDDVALDAQPELLTRKVTVGVHRSVPGAIDATSVKGTLDRMNAVLEKNEPGYEGECDDISGDVDVRVHFELDSFTTFDVGDGEINCEEEYREIADLGYGFAIVSSIAWCSCTQTVHPEILGCASQKDAVVVALPDFGVEPVVWAHEYGHFAGLGHSADMRNVMFTHASRCKVHVDGGQRELYRTPTDQPAALETCSYGVLELVQPAESDAALEDQLREFVTGTHVHGLSYEQARVFGARPHALDYLLDLLGDENFRAHHGQVALAIGAIGGERAIDGLKAFVEGARLDRDSLRAVRTAIPAIGWALSSPEAEPFVEKTLAFLGERARPGFWQPSVPGFAEDERKAAAADLGKRAALGLAFSGKNAGDSLGQALSGAEDEDFRGVLRHMQRVNREIQESEGGNLAAYYARRR